VVTHRVSTGSWRPAPRTNEVHRNRSLISVVRASRREYCLAAPRTYLGAIAAFNTFQGADPDTLYFTAGIQDESLGLLGNIRWCAAGRDRRTRRSIGRGRTSGRPRVMSLTGMAWNHY
jgi:hypothetical protein